MHCHLGLKFCSSLAETAGLQRQDSESNAPFHSVPAVGAKTAFQLGTNQL
jgi:hypothetical protein